MEGEPGHAEVSESSSSPSFQNTALGQENEATVH